MKEVLSQAEIDSLLAALSAGEVKAEELHLNQEQKNVKTYDFKRPNKFSKDQLRTLYMIHDNFARIVSNYLSVYLRTNVQVRVATVDQITYEDFTRSIPSPTLLAVFGMEPLNGTAILETNLLFVFPIIDILFGGIGDSNIKVRELTDLELSVLKKLYTKILDNLTTAWSDIIELSSRIDSLETNPRFNQVISPNETVAIITFMTSVGNSQGLMNLCLPYITLEAIISKLSAHYWFATSNLSTEEEQRLKIRKQVSKMPLEVKAFLGQNTITVREFLDMQQGDILTLETNLKDKQLVYIEDKLFAKAQLGAIGNKRAIQVTEIISEGGEYIE